jgi:hypothetical protein
MIRPELTQASDILLPYIGSLISTRRQLHERAFIVHPTKCKPVRRPAAGPLKRSTPENPNFVDQLTVRKTLVHGLVGARRSPPEGEIPSDVMIVDDFKCYRIPIRSVFIFTKWRSCGVEYNISYESPREGCKGRIIDASRFRQRAALKDLPGYLRHPALGLTYRTRVVWKACK